MSGAKIIENTANILKALKQIVWRLLVRWKNSLDWKTCSILISISCVSSIISEIRNQLSSLVIPNKFMLPFWNLQNITIFFRTAKSTIAVFLKFPYPNSTFNVRKALRLTYLTRLHVGLSHLREHKFRHSFRDSQNPICNCRNSIAWTKHYLLHFSNFKNERQFLLQNVRIVNPNLIPWARMHWPTYYYYRDNTLTGNTNTILLYSAIEYL